MRDEPNSAKAAFDAAIARGVLSADATADNYAGRFMYMGDDSTGAHLFKHVMTRAYLAPVAPAPVTHEFVTLGNGATHLLPRKVTP